MLAIEHLLTPFGFDLTKKYKLVRHQDKNYDVQKLYRAGQLEVYQSYQGDPVFDKCDAIISFLGSEKNHALFVGVYWVEGRIDNGIPKLPADFIYPQMESDKYYYSLRKDDRFKDLEQRVVIDWGPGALAWVQNFKINHKPVVEVLPPGYVKEFPGFLNFALRYDELESIVNNPYANREWHRMLSSVAGVYLILDSANGLQYVGSAYGEKGIMGRWKTYVGSGHGGNEQLKALLAEKPRAERGFIFSILQTLPRTLTAKEVVDVEKLYKQKLGSRAHGLNSN